MSRVLACGMLLVSLFQLPAWGTNLSDAVDEVGANWLIGTWEMTSEQGDRFTIAYEWALSKNAIMVEYRSPKMTSKGMIAYNANADQVVYHSVDNQGGIGSGIWSETSGNPTLFFEGTNANGEINRMGFLFKKVGENTTQLEVYQLEGTATLASSPSMTAELKRKQ